LKNAPCRYDSRVASIDLPLQRSAAAQARRFVREVCASWGLVHEVIDDIELLVSELVTNAVLHARSAARLTIEHLGDCIRVTVADSSVVPPRLREYGPEAATGRGVFLVDRLAREWGVETDDRAGKRVWFEVAVEPANEGSHA
jgi:anti-sigma regulatory factor (Ser/Thr protein kinase)